ncbi:MAG TPA: hypothetical protein VH598_16110 [Verrucomicrobiae bacterium]|nr:hypothetical protein [Verrucomicrobiae bacterium]
MKTTLFVLGAAFLSVTVNAQKNPFESTTPPPPPPAPAPVYLAPTPTASPAVYVYDQKPLPNQPALISPEQAQSIVDRFKTNYAKQENPRILIYVNRELTEDKPAEKTANEKPAPTLADRQTVRDVERLFGRPLRAAGASLVDQQAARQLALSAKDAANPGGDTNREALSQIADVALEVLISSRNIVVSEASGDRTYTVPDIQATAIRLRDSKVLGQASAAEVLNRAGSPHDFDVNQVAEATALALMEDMLREAGK